MKRSSSIQSLSSRGGFTLLELMLVVAIVVMLALISVNAFERARIRSFRATCLNNLRILDGVKEQYVLENQTVFPSGQGDLVAGGFIEYAVSCPANGTYQNFNVPSYVVCSQSAAPYYHDATVGSTP